MLKNIKANNWTKDELQKIANNDDLHISVLRPDNTTYGSMTWIWSVVVDNALYARAYHGQKSSWYQASMKQEFGKITSAGIASAVLFQPVSDDISDAIDEAYKKKYASSPYLSSMLAKSAKSATVQISPVPSTSSNES